MAVLGFGVIFHSVLGADEVEVISLKPSKGMDRADLVCVRLVPKPLAVLVLCPGYNQSARGMVEQEIWQEYARKNHLGLAGLSFSLPENLLADKEGYYLVEDGSGDCLVRGIEQGFKEKNLPIFLYGFSGGAHFAGNFAEWKPERVKGWCAYSAAWWERPVAKDGQRIPPGIIGCGQLDRYRFSASLLFFKQGRALDRPWLWVELKGENHAWPKQLDAFVRDYFSAILSDPKKEGVYMDLDTKETVQPPLPTGQETLYGWLPDSALVESWRRVHCP